MLVIRHQLLDFHSPIVMGIVNITPDSFAVHCGSVDEVGVLTECERLVSAGVDWLDIGACSTRPGGEIVTEEEEIRRLDIALKAIRKVYPKLIISIDTFRSRVAAYALAQYGVDVINDVSGLKDAGMIDVLAHANIPYILTCPTSSGTDMLSFFISALNRLREAGVKDVILDPGLGFGKTLDQNYACLHELSIVKKLGCLVLVGMSRKSMIYNTLNCAPQEALNGTTAAHMLALINGADILRVHDGKEAKETIAIWKKYCH